MLIKETAEFDYVPDMSGKSPWKRNFEGANNLDGNSDWDWFWPKLKSNRHRKSAYKYYFIKIPKLKLVKNKDNYGREFETAIPSGEGDQTFMIKAPAGYREDFFYEKIEHFLQYRYNYSGDWEIEGTAEVNVSKPKPREGGWQKDLDWELVRDTDKVELERSLNKVSNKDFKGIYRPRDAESLQQFKRGSHTTFNYHKMKKK